MTVPPDAACPAVCRRRHCRVRRLPPPILQRRASRAAAADYVRFIVVTVRHFMLPSR